MSSDTVIKVENLSKKYRIGEYQGYNTLREAIVEAIKVPENALRYLLKSPSFKLNFSNPRSFAEDSKRSSEGDTIWALKDVNFEVKQGEVVGIIGRNGAGKSTLLKILSKITEPTTGRVELRGRVGSLLEVGTGFHPELTGHENVYMYGAILGMDRWEVTRKFDEIVAFAELERFIETPVKRYSSGMYMRLAFAVAAHLEPEILLVDEVLAVGDLDFQKKCIGKMDSISNEGRTVIFVSHNMRAIRNLCTRGVLLDQSRVKRIGTVEKIVDEYENISIDENDGRWVSNSNHRLDSAGWIEEIEVIDENGRNRTHFVNSEKISIRFTVYIREPNPNFKVGFDLFRNGEVVFRSHQVDSPKKIDWPNQDRVSLVCKIPSYLLNTGDYFLRPLISIHCVRRLMDEIPPVLKFRVEIDSSNSDFHVNYNERTQPGTVFPLLNWEIHANETA